MKNLELLKNLYMAYSPSGQEGRVQDIIMDFLDKRKIPFKIDPYGQLYAATGKPLLSAHMDQVSNKPISQLTTKAGIIAGNGNLGADDKNGIWTVLNILETYPDTSFLFSVEEERGGKPFPDEIESSPYALVFDRKGKGDIIGEMNGYCSRKFEKLVSQHAKQFKYKPNMGTYSDANQLSDMRIPCVNLSVGYYNAHTSMEYTVLSELQNALNLGLHLVENLPTIRNPAWEPETLVQWFPRSKRIIQDVFDSVDVRCDCCGMLEWRENTTEVDGLYFCEFCMEYLTEEAI